MKLGDISKLKRKIISNLLVISFILGCFSGLVYFEDLVDDWSVKAATIIVDSQGAGDYTSIQTAIDNAKSGDIIYVWAGTYNENLSVNKTVTLIGNGTSQTIIQGGWGDEVIKISSNWVNVTGFSIKYGRRGVYISSDNVKISNLSISRILGESGSQAPTGANGHMAAGIYLDSTSGTNIINNTIFDLAGGTGGLFTSNKTGGMGGAGFGIYLKTSNNNTIIYNTIYDINGGKGGKGGNGGTGLNGGPGSKGNIGAGIYLESSTYNTIENNILKDIDGGAGGAGGRGGDGQSYIDGGDGGNAGNGAVGSGIYFLKSTNNTIKDNTIQTVTGGTGGTGGFGGDGQWTLPVQAASSGGDGGNAGKGELGSGIYFVISPYNKIINNSITSINGGPGANGGDGGDWNHIGGAKGGDGGRGGNGCQGAGVYLKKSTYNSLQGNIIDTVDGGAGGTGGSAGPWGTNGANGQGSTGNGIYLHKANNTKINNNNCSNSDHGILIDQSSNNLVNSNNFSNNNNGVNLDSCSINTIMQNICFNNSYGIFLSSSTNVIILNNTCPNNENGIMLYFSSSNEILSNDCCLNDYGIYLEDSKDNNIKENFCSSNDRTGIWVEYSNVNNLSNNTCLNNYYYGIELYYSDNCMILNNTCNNNFIGIVLWDSDKNMIINNTCNSNSYGGILVFAMITVEYSYKNMIINNTCNSNLKNGIWLSRSPYNELRANIFNFNNGTGIHLTASENCTINNNTISNNNLGLNFTSSSKNNHIYHNNIISNAKQAIDNGSNNNWNNSQQEGNYWSDYTGLDNGAGGRLKGDGIGDTLIPHLNLDNYPFINKSGWLYPVIPILHDPGDLDSDGSYEITWKKNARTVGYILEEDTSNIFNNPAEIYNGIDLNFQIINKPNGTYFYRLKAYNENYISQCSNIEDITVDWLPDTPKNFTIVSNPHGNALNLSWDLNPVDTKEYILEYKNEITRNWQQLEPISHPNYTYNHIGLDDGVKYDYRIQAQDHRDQASGFSEIISGIPRDMIPPAAPTGLKVVSKTKDSISLVWNPNIEDDLNGYNLFRSKTLNPSNWGESIGTIPKDTEEFTDTGLDEEITYYYVVKAFDEVPNYSLISNVASDTTPDETPPIPPTGLKISDRTQNSLMLSWEPNPEEDLVGYYIFKSPSSIKSFTQINQKPISKTQYIDSGLKEGTIYYYKLKAVDDVDLKSDFSEIVAGKTLLGPYGPEINNTISSVTILEDGYDDKSVNLYYLFKDKNNDPLVFWCTGNSKINVTIFQSNGMVILEPEQDWSGEEIITFFATDNIVQDSVNFPITVIVEPVNDPPGPVEIISPDDNFEIYYSTPLYFEANCTDPDIPYGDKLTYTWRSDLSGEIGTGRTLKEIKLEVGEHKITVTVEDNNGMLSTNSVQVLVIQIDLTKDNDGDGIPNGWELENNLNINDPTDAEQDYDNDGLTNLEEYKKNTNPRNPDTDGDNYNDKVDAYPLDETRWKKESTNKRSEDSDLFNLIPGIVIIIVILIVVILIIFMLMKKKKKYPEILKREPVEPVIQQQVIAPRAQPKTQIQQPKPQPQQIMQPRPQVSEPSVNPSKQYITHSQPAVTTQITTQDKSPPYQY